MSLDAVREQIAAIAAAVSGAGRVHQYQRWSADTKTLRDLFKHEDGDGTARINACVITRKGTAKREFTGGQIQRVHVFRVRFYRSMADGGASEPDFQDYLEDTGAAFDTNYTLNGTCETTTCEWGPMTGLAGLQIDDVDLVMFGGVLCHFADCRLGVQEEPD